MLDHTLKLELGTDRHLIVGDLHGRYDEFMQLLEIANYDPTKDVIYSVGDIIDRGPKSVECMEFFQRERCYAIKGNHELMMMESEWFATWLNNGGMECMDSLEKHNYTTETFINLFRNFPWVIDVGENDEKHAFRLVHAEMPPEWPESYFQRTLNEALNSDDTSFARLLWSRKLITAARKNVDNLQPANTGIEFHSERYRAVFTGHSYAEKAFTCGDHWFIDTGQGWKSHLTLIDATTKEKFTIDCPSI